MDKLDSKVMFREGVGLDFLSGDELILASLMRTSEARFFDFDGSEAGRAGKSTSPSGLDFSCASEGLEVRAGVA